MASLILAGVPEQVNIPINICIERGIFKKYGIDVTFRLVPEGTGAMLNLLEEGGADLALTVTDAFMVGKANGRKVELLGTFVESPLVWAVAGIYVHRYVSVYLYKHDCVYVFIYTYLYIYICIYIYIYVYMYIYICIYIYIYTYI
jgi:hypothetical protein